MPLYIVSTPIGNFGDTTKRALETLAFCHIVLCEDTRQTNNLLDFYQMKPKPKLISFYEENAEKRQEQVINWLKENKKIALVSNAGTPTISDPGFKLVRRCRKEGIAVFSVPGPVALIAALSISGLPTDKFMFLGFLPKKNGKKEAIFSSCLALKDSPLSPTFIFYESPYRLEKTLKLMRKVLGEAQVVITRELTKIYEEKISGTPDEVLEKIAGKKIKGEITVVFYIRG